MRSLADQLRLRDRASAAIRGHFRGQGFLEVETPMLVPGPGLEPHIDPLVVEVRAGPDAAPATRYLHTSPELALKRVLAAFAEDGAPARVFQLARVFRDGELGPLHRPEFTMLEWYRAPGTLDDVIADAEALLREVAAGLGEPPPFALDRFDRVTVADLFSGAGIDLGAALDEEQAGDAAALARRARAAGHHVMAGAGFEDAFFHVMMSAIEPGLGRGRPIVVERYPRSMAVLARGCDDDPRYAARFELYAGGVELANAFDELTDPVEQRARFLDDNRARRALGKPALPLDEDFLAALGRLPRSAGIALGVDRLLMVLVGASGLSEVEGLPWR